MATNHNYFTDFLIDDSLETNRNGNRIYRGFLPANRYTIDFDSTFQAEHWQQYDTDQDAHYFGVWVNPQQLRTLTYAEGDWTLSISPNISSYNAEIVDMNQFYGEGFTAITYDEDGKTIYRQDRQSFLLS